MIIYLLVSKLLQTQEDAEAFVLAREGRKKSPLSGDKKAGWFLGGACIFGTAPRAGKQVGSQGRQVGKRDAPREGERCEARKNVWVHHWQQ